MNMPLPAGAVALDADELDRIVGGSIWRVIAGAASAGFVAGRWIACALLCLGDA